MKVLVIVPTKLDSTRLEKKNIRKLAGKPMFLHSVEYANQSKYQVTVLVSSENEEVRLICEQNCVNFIKRPKELCGDAEVVDVYLDVVQQVDSEYDLVVGLQPDNPNRSHTLDECIDYMLNNNYDDLVTVNPNYKRSGSVRIFKYQYLKEGKISKRLGCIKDSAIDIHYESDLELVKEKLQ